jgi:hypothetical protein
MLMLSVVVSTGFIASGSFFYSPIFTALICGLSQVTLFKVLNSRQIIRERAGLVTTEVQDAPTTEWKMVNVSRLELSSYSR